MVKSPSGRLAEKHRTVPVTGTLGSGPEIRAKQWDPQSKRKMLWRTIQSPNYSQFVWTALLEVQLKIWIALATSKILVKLREQNSTPDLEMAK